MALRDTEQQRFAAILTTLSTPTPFETDIAQRELKKKQRWSGKEKTVEHLLDGFFIVMRLSSPMNISIVEFESRCIIVQLKIHRMSLF